MTHGFVMEFASQEDRNYYIHDDPHHLRLESQIRALMEDGVAVDFTPTIFYDWASPETNGAKARGKK
jgi:Stress responsive A/B Barrel Domain